VSALLFVWAWACPSAFPDRGKPCPYIEILTVCVIIGLDLIIQNNPNFNWIPVFTGMTSWHIGPLRQGAGG